MSEREVIKLLGEAMSAIRRLDIDCYTKSMGRARRAIAELGDPPRLVGEETLIFALTELERPERLVPLYERALSLINGRSRVVPRGTPMLLDYYDPFATCWHELGSADATGRLVERAEELWNRLTGCGICTATLYWARLRYFRGEMTEAAHLALEGYRAARAEGQELNALCAAEILGLISRHGLFVRDAEAAMEYIKTACEKSERRVVRQAAEIVRSNIHLSMGILSETPDWIRNGDFGAASSPEPPGWYMLEDKLEPVLFPMAMLDRMQYLNYAERYIEALNLADSARLVFRLESPLVDLYLRFWQSGCYKELGDEGRYREEMRSILSAIAPDGLWMIPGEYEPALPMLLEMAEELGPDAAEKLRAAGTGLWDSMAVIRDAYLRELRPEDLTPKELEVIRLVNMGHTNAQTAKMLGVSEETVKSHLKHAFDKLNVRSRMQISKALRYTKDAMSARWAK